MRSAQGKSGLASSQLTQSFDDYATYHKTKGNRIFHYVGIIFSVASLLGLLGGVVIGPDGLTGSIYFRLDGGTLLLSVSILRYLFLDWKITIPFAFVLTGLYFFGRALPNFTNWSLFTGGWILQGIGHAVYEKKSPPFLKNGMHLFIGPLWIFARVLKYN